MYTRRLSLFVWCGFGLLALSLLVACERPEPEETLTAVPTQTATVEPESPTTTPVPTAAALQLFVVIVQPTADEPQLVMQEAQSIALAPSPTAATIPTAQMTPEPTALPANYYLGWAWTNSLAIDGEQAEVDRLGLTLRNMPSIEGEQLGLVMGLATVIVTGKERCGYTPVLVHAVDLLTRTSPLPPVERPQPLSKDSGAIPLATATREGTVPGWAYTEELTIIGQTAISGPLGLNLRAEPCRFGSNVGFVPGGANMIVVGPPTGEYTPVRVDDDVIQVPLDPETIRALGALPAPASLSTTMTTTLTAVTTIPTASASATATPVP